MSPKGEHNDDWHRSGRTSGQRHSRSYQSGRERDDQYQPHGQYRNNDVDYSRHESSRREDQQVFREEQDRPEDRHREGRHQAHQPDRAADHHHSHRTHHSHSGRTYYANGEPRFEPRQQNNQGYRVPTSQPEQSLYDPSLDGSSTDPNPGRQVSSAVSSDYRPQEPETNICASSVRSGDFELRSERARVHVPVPPYQRPVQEPYDHSRQPPRFLQAQEVLDGFDRVYYLSDTRDPPRPRTRR